MTDAEKLVTLSTKLPAALRDAFVALARRRTLTESSLLRRLVERELAGAADYETGEVEQAVRAELEERGHSGSSARAATALNVARRLDRDPTSGPALAGQLQRLLADLVPVQAPVGFDTVAFTRLQADLKMAGFLIVRREAVADERSARFSTLTDWRDEFGRCVQ